MFKLTSSLLDPRLNNKRWGDGKAATSVTKHVSDSKDNAKNHGIYAIMPHALAINRILNVIRVADHSSVQFLSVDKL